MIALAVVLLPLAMAGSIGYQQPMMMMPQQQQWGQQQQQWGQPQQQWGWGMQMQGQMRPDDDDDDHNSGSNQWWGMDSKEEYDAYMRWCEERRLAIQEQEAQQALLHEIEERQEAAARAVQQEKAAKEMQMKREAMVAQWRMWQSQLSQASEFDGWMEKFTEMKIEYMFTLTMEFLKFCSACTDNTAHLQRYLIYGSHSYQPPSASEAFNVEDLNGIDTTSVEAVAQRLAVLPDSDGVKAFFGGAVESMCDGVKGYIEQLRLWEAQYNFMGH